MGQVATVKTPLTYGQALGAFLLAGCPNSAVLMVAAQSAVETAGFQALHNNNLGNITPTASQAASGPWMNQGLNMKYISYPNAVAGAKGMLNWLSTHGLLSFAAANDLDGYMSRLQATCYLGCVGQVDGTGHTVSTTDYTNYRAGIASWMHKLSGVTPVDPPGVWPWQDVALVGGGVAAIIVAAVAAARPEWLRAPLDHLRH